MIEKNLISEIKPFDIENLVNLKIVQGGMIPKIKNCIDAVENGVRGVVILDGRKPTLYFLKYSQIKELEL